MENKLSYPEAAEFLGIKVTTLRNWVCKGTGPRNYRFLGRVYFDKKDLEAFRRSLIEVRAG
jgi:DNA-binding transcriptional MerR regulator